MSTSTHHAVMVQTGGTIAYTPAAAVAAGTILALGAFVAVALRDIAASEQGAVTLDGVFKFPKDATSGPIFAIGDDVYWDSVNELATNAPASASGAQYLGLCTKAAGASDAFVEARLVQTAPPAFVDKVFEEVTLASGSKTLDIQDVGKVLNVLGHATNVVTLPATGAGLEFVIRAAADGERLAISPNASDLIFGPDLAGVDDKDRILAAATARRGDYIHLRHGGATGWAIIAERGLWTAEA